MGYCDSDDVIAEFKSLVLTSGSSVTSDTVDEFISQASAEIDGRLNTKYVTPITGDNSLEIVKNICTWLVVDRVEKILDLKSKPPIQGDGTKVIKLGSGSAKDARNMIQDIMENKLVLIDAILRNSSGGIKSRNVSHNQRHEFKRNYDQW